MSRWCFENDVMDLRVLRAFTMKFSSDSKERARVSTQTTGMRCIFGLNGADGAPCFCLRAFICAQILGLCFAGRRNGEDCSV